jgi:flagellar hook-associated protein 1 FlgK
VGNALSGIVAEFGASAERMRLAATHQADLLSHVESLREQTSGVSIDEEMIQMTRSQRAYEAVLKVIQTTDEMLDTLLRI